jgi:vesicular inhibitory amino acid transporter
MKGHPSVPKPDISFDQIAMTFGNLSLAYGAGIVIPALQRQHSEPERMPRVICVTLTIVSVFFITLASTGYSAIGCQIAGNLLFSIFPHPSTGLATLGFSPNKGWAILAFLFMQLHITVAFAVILHPALYVFERTLLGMHKRQAEYDQHIQDIEAAADYVVADTPVENTDKATPTAEDSKAAMGPKAPRASKTGSVVSMVDIMREIDDEDAELAEYKGHEFKYIPMRILLIVLMTALSIALKDHFSDLADFVGASAISVSCMIMPILFYFKKLWTTLPVWEKAFGSLVVVVCAVLGVYVSIQTGKALFKSGTPKPGAPVFEFCHKEHQFDLYYNATLAHSG